MNKLNSKRIKNVIRKEWKIMYSDANSALFVTLLPFVIVVQALILIYLVIQFGGEDALVNTILNRGMENWLRAHPEMSTLSIIEQFQVFFVGQIPFYFLVIPAMVAMSFATFSIVEEKQEKTLEPLLATPVKTEELLLGKSLAGLVPAVIMTWVCAGAFLIIIAAMGWAHLLPLIVNAEWVISLFGLVPLVSLLAFMLGVVGSSRAKDAKSAQNIALLVVLPVLGIVGIQLTGIAVFAGWMLLGVCLVTFVVNVAVLKIAVKLFQRESIVVKWQ